MNSKKILIVEDEETSRQIITLAMEGKDRELVFAGDGDEAVQVARDQRPDLIIMDLMLPHLNGYEATRRIKNDPDLKNIPVVAITARTGDYGEKKALEAGCEDYITKPFQLGALRERLARYLTDE